MRKIKIYSAELKEWRVSRISSTLRQVRCQNCRTGVLEIFSGKYWMFGERVLAPKKVTRDELHQRTCLLLQKESR